MAGKNSANYAGFGIRLLAAFIDGLVLIVPAIIISIAIAMTNKDLAQFSGWIVSLLFYIYNMIMDVKYGQTLGKMAVKIKVVKVNGEKLTYVDAFLREVVGKFLSGLILDLGYLWVIWDSQKQGWHDKIASTIVVKTN